MNLSWPKWGILEVMKLKNLSTIQALKNIQLINPSEIKQQQHMRNINPPVKGLRAVVASPTTALVQPVHPFVDKLKEPQHQAARLELVLTAQMPPMGPSERVLFTYRFPCFCNGMVLKQ